MRKQVPSSSALSIAPSEGMQRMKTLMARFREQPPRSMAGIPVAGVRDYQSGTILRADGSRETLDGPRGDMVIIDLAASGNYVAARPSGTEPKVKFYMFTYLPAEQLADLQLARDEMAGGRMSRQDRERRTASSVARS